MTSLETEIIDAEDMMRAYRGWLVDSLESVDEILVEYGYETDKQASLTVIGGKTVDAIIDVICVIEDHIRDATHASRQLAQNQYLISGELDK